MTALVFEDYVSTLDEMGWFFSFLESIYGPFYTEVEANLALDSMMSDYYQEDDENEPLYQNPQNRASPFITGHEPGQVEGNYQSTSN